MFSDKKEGNYIYILTKSDKPFVRIGEIEEVIPVTHFPTYAPNNPYSFIQEKFVNIKVKCGDENVNLEKLPASADQFCYSDNVFVFEKKEALIAEVDSMMQTSIQKIKRAIKDEPYHKSVISHCNSIMQEINPQFAKEKEQEEKIKSLENEISSMKDDLTYMKGGLGDIKSLIIEMNSKPRTTSKN